MNSNFDIIYEKIIQFANLILSNNVVDEKFQQNINIYNNFFHQMIQILDNLESVDGVTRDKVRKLYDKNYEVESHLTKMKYDIKEEIFKANKTETLRRIYGGGNTSGFTRKS